MKLRKQVTVCGGAIFCVAVFSLYLMLDRVQHDPARRQNGGNFPRVSASGAAVSVMSSIPNGMLFLKHFFGFTFFFFLLLGLCVVETITADLEL